MQLRSVIVGALLIVAGFCVARLPAQSVPAPAASDARTDLVAYMSQRAALQPADISGRLSLAHWATSREMWSQAAEMAHEVLDRDADNRSAWSILQQVDDAVLLPAEPQVEEALKAEFQKRFDRQFKTREARHFLICYDTTDAFASQRGSTLEKAYDAFLFNFNMRKLRPEFLNKRLVVILFKSRDDYLAYAKKTEGADLSWAAGYYSQRTNRTAFYDDSTGPGTENVEQVVGQLRAKLKDLNGQIAHATSQNQTGLANTLAVERNRISAAVTQIDLRVGNTVGMLNNVKTVHEAAHQLAFNTGIQARLVDYPLWFSEGLACSFEIEDSNHRRGPGVINTGRVGVLKDAIRKGKMVPLEKFITYAQPAKMDDEALGIFYAESWGLFHYLYHTDRQGLENYLLAYRGLKAMRAVSPDDRLRLFTDAFGTDTGEMEKGFVAYFKNLPPRS